MNFLFESTKCSFKSCTSAKMNDLPHLHHYAEVIYIISGELNLSIAQQQQELHAGDAAVIFPDNIHFGKCSDDFVMLQFQFEPDSLSAHVDNIMHNYSISDPFVKSTRLSMLSRNTLNTIIQQDSESNDHRDHDFHNYKDYTCANNELCRMSAYKGVLLILVNDILSKCELVERTTPAMSNQHIHNFTQTA